MYKEFRFTRMDGDSSSEKSLAEIVPGDIIILQPFRYVPFDAVILDIPSGVLSVDESMISGDARSVYKLAVPNPTLSDVIAPEVNRIWAGSWITACPSTGCIVRVWKIGADCRYAYIIDQMNQHRRHKMSGAIQKKIDSLSFHWNGILILCLTLTFFGLYMWLGFDRNDTVFFVCATGSILFLEPVLWKEAILKISVNTWNRLRQSSVLVGHEGCVDACLEHTDQLIGSHIGLIERLSKIDVIGEFHNFIQVFIFRSYE